MSFVRLPLPLPAVQVLLPSMHVLRQDLSVEVADRIEDRSVGGFRGRFIDFRGQKRLNAIGQAVHEGDFNKDQRIIWDGRMEEGKAFSVGCQTTTQIFPALNFMDCLIADQFFKDGRRGIPINVTQLKEAKEKAA